MATSNTEDLINPAHGQVLSSGIYQLLLQRRMLDVTITCGGEAIMAHKAVLVAFSKFLDTVFSGQGDDCDVLNMDNLGLDFEAIRAVIFFMYKGAVDMDRCGEEAFNNAAKVLAVDTSSKAPPKAPAPTTSALVTVQPAAPVIVPTPGTSLLSKPPPRSTMKDQMTMTETPRLLKLTRYTQTDGSESISSAGSKNAAPKTKQLAHRQTQTMGSMTLVDKVSQTATPLLNTLGLKVSINNAQVISSTPKKAPESEKKKLEAEKESSKKTTPQVMLRRGEKRKRDEEIKEDEGEDDKAADEKEEEVSTPKTRKSIAASASESKVTKVKEELTPEPVKKGRGRPRKQPKTDDNSNTPTSSSAPATPSTSTASTPSTGTARRRGRPPKKPEVDPSPKPSESESATPTGDDDAKPTPRRGRLPASAKKTTMTSTAEVEDSPVAAADPPKRGRGRLRTIKSTMKDDSFDWMGSPTPRRSKQGGVNIKKEPKESSESINEATLTKVKIEPDETVKKKRPGHSNQGELLEPDETAKKKRPGRSNQEELLEPDETTKKKRPSRSNQEELFAPDETVKKKRPGRSNQGELYSESKRELWERDAQGNFNCLQCDWSRPSSKSLLVHLRIHLDERPYICDQCAKGFRTTDKLKDHLRVHTTERPFECAYCTNSFKTHKAMLRHQLVHTENKYHKCQQCPKAFYTAERLTVHVAHVHEKIKKYGCSVTNCDYRASERKSIAYHMAEKHGHPLPANLVTMCDICGMSIRNSSLRMHKLIHTAKNLKCTVCSFATQYRNTLNGHMQRLHGMNIDGTPAVKPYACQTCDQSFFSRQQLKFHELRHKGTKPHKCPICDFATVDKGSMNMHIRTHTGATPYTCTQCGKSFKQSSALHWHVRTVHEGLRHFKCTECDKSYVNKKDLRAHRFSVHLKIKPFSCPHCHYHCTKRDYLAHHIARAHGTHLVPKDLAATPRQKIELKDEALEDLKPTYDQSEDSDKPDIVNYSVVENVLEQEDAAGNGEIAHPVVVVAPETLHEMQSFQNIAVGAGQVIAEGSGEGSEIQATHTVVYQAADGSEVQQFEAFKYEGDEDVKYEIQLEDGTKVAYKVQGDVNDQQAQE